MKVIINLNVKKTSMKLSWHIPKKDKIEMPSFKKEVLSNVYEMRPYLIVYVVAWPMIGYLPYTGTFSYPGADILTFFCLTIQSLHGDSDKHYFDNKHFFSNDMGQ